MGECPCLDRRPPRRLIGAVGAACGFMLLLAAAAQAGVGRPVGTQPCAGDCDASGSVAVQELVLGVGIALNLRSADLCAAMDADVDGAVSVAELVTAVEYAHNGCAPADCGDAMVTERFVRCQSTESEIDCLAEGGTWGRYPASGRPGCFCPTGQGGCPCISSSDCVGICIADDEPFGDDCGRAERGSCTDREPTAGCFCAFYGAGDRAARLCIDP